MVAPPMGAGAGAGAAAAAAAAAAQPGGGAKPLDYNQELNDSPVLRVANLLRRLGLNSPMAQNNMFSGPVADRLGSMLDPWLDSQGLAGGPNATGVNGTNVVDNMGGLIDKFASYMKTGGGGMGAVMNDARNAQQIITSDPRYTSGLKDTEMIAFLKSLNQLATSGNNDWMRRAWGNLQDQSVGQYSDYYDQMRNGGGAAGSTDYLHYIQQDPRYTFLTGR